MPKKNRRIIAINRQIYVIELCDNVIHNVFEYPFYDSMTSMFENSSFCVSELLAGRIAFFVVPVQN